MLAVRRVPKEAAEQCLERLRACGNLEAAVVGEVMNSVGSGAGDDARPDSMPLVEVCY